jgi:putative hemolysin
MNLVGTGIMPSPITSSLGCYRLRQAVTTTDLHAVQKLRFLVFNIELKEGLQQSFDTGLDKDDFDSVCDHLLVENTETGEVVGTYRMQTGNVAAQNLGYYCEREFDFSPFDSLRDSMLELGRACIHEDHRSFAVLSLLWGGIGSYAKQRDVRYIFGCSSLTSQDACLGARAYSQLTPYFAPLRYRTVPLQGFACSLDTLMQQPVVVPKLLSKYLALGAWICGPPAIDREFKTIDFLTLLDLESPEMALRRKRFEGL